MSKYRQAAKVDESQKALVHVLRRIPGVTVALGHDDILVGREVNGVKMTYWFEIKTPDQRKKNGEWKAGALKDSQEELLKNWKGHYSIVSSLEEIMVEIGLTKKKS